MKGRPWGRPFICTDPLIRATIASAVILAHSAVDYPLRTGAIAAIFGVALALIAQRLRSTPTRSTKHVKLG